MIRWSSNWTLFYRVFVPVFYAVFYGFLAGWLLIAPPKELAAYPWMSYVNLGFYLFMLGFMYFTVFRLKRVDVGEDHLVVTNYQQARRYTLDSIADFDVQRFLLFRIGCLSFHEKGYFGKDIRFLVDSRQEEKILDAYPEMLRPILSSEEPSHGED